MIKLTASSMAYSKEYWEKKVESLSTQITQTANAIELKASKSYVDDKHSLSEAKISVMCDKIGLSIASNGQSATLDLSSDMISAISSNVQIQASNITLEGYTTVNGKFSIDNSGNMSASGGEIGGFSISTDRLSSTISMTNGVKGVTINTDRIDLTKLNYSDHKYSTIEINNDRSGYGDSSIDLLCKNNLTNEVYGNISLCASGDASFSGAVSCNKVNASSVSCVQGLSEYQQPLSKRYTRVYTSADFRNTNNVTTPSNSQMIIELGRDFTLDSSKTRYYISIGTDGKIYGGVANNNSTSITWTQT